MKSISVFGLGYVGAVTAGCFASVGHNVIGVDVSPEKVEMLQSGKAPVMEPGLSQLIADASKAGRLRATLDARLAVRASEISFVCVGTPSLHNGRAALSSVPYSCEQTGRA